MDSLIAIIDARPSSWAALNAVQQGAEAASGSAGTPAPTSSCCDFSSTVTTLETFICAFGAGSRRNQLAVLAFNDSIGGYVLPRNDRDAAASSISDDAGSCDIMRPAAIRKTVGDALMDLHYGKVDDAGSAINAIESVQLSPRYASLAACLSLAVCHHHKLKRFHQKLRSRVLIVQAGPDAPSQYVPLVNAAFSAQRYGITIDSLLLTPEGPVASGSGSEATSIVSSGFSSADVTSSSSSAPSSNSISSSASSRNRRHSVFLEQAAYLTGGLHVHPKPVQHPALLALMVHMLLPSPSDRSRLLLPPSSSVDLRAHCFCHRAHRTVAWVCTICLSIFCEFSAVCATCGTRAPDAVAGAATAVSAGGAAGR